MNTRSFQYESPIQNSLLILLAFLGSAKIALKGMQTPFCGNFLDSEPKKAQ